MAGHDHSPVNDERDYFAQRVENRLIKELKNLKIDDAKISVDRHDGKNTKVIVGVILKDTEESDIEIDSDVRVVSSNRLTSGEAKDIKNILNDLFQNCTVKYGDITILVKKGRLEKTVFSYSQLPHESCDQHFTPI